MLARAADWLKPGGTLVYSVCSLEPEEGEQVVQPFLAARPDYALDPIAPDELPSAMRPNVGILRILPGTLEDTGGHDGVFIARMRRNNGGVVIPPPCHRPSTGIKLLEQ